MVQMQLSQAKDCRTERNPCNVTAYDIGEKQDAKVLDALSALQAFLNNYDIVSTLHCFI